MMADNTEDWKKLDDVHWLQKKELASVFPPIPRWQRVEGGRLVLVDSKEEKQQHKEINYGKCST